MAIAIPMSRDLWRDRINDMFSIGLLKAIAYDKYIMVGIGFGV
jgi:hypothetical protein